MRYYEIEDDVFIEGRWYLNGLRDNTGRELDSRDFTYGRRLGVDGPLMVSLYDESTLVAVEQPFKVRLRRKGKPLDFTFADFDMPVVTRALGELIGTIAGRDVQRFGLNVSSREQQYEILNVVTCLSCIDTDRSEIEWWTEEDERPDKLGQPQMITKLRIHGEKIGGAHIFRLDGWDVAVIVSDVLKQAMERSGVTGLIFRKV